MRAAAVIPARAGSKGLPDKNALLIAGKPMVVRAIGAVREAGSIIEKTLVSTDSPAVAKLSLEAGTSVVERPEELAGDAVGLEGAARHALRTVYPDGNFPEATLVIQPNLPVWQPGIVAKVLARLAEGDCTAAGSCHVVDQRPEWMKKCDKRGFVTPFLPAERIAIRRQDFPELCYFDGAVLAVLTDVLMQSEGQPVSHLYYLGDKIAPVLRPEVYGMEVHDPADIPKVEIAIDYLERTGYPQ